jgi:hypothetical protein
MLDQAELELYAQESKVSHRRNMKSVEIFSKDGYKKGLKDIVKLVQHECKDTVLVRHVLKIAGKCLSTDAGLGNFASEYGDDSDSDSDSSVEIKGAFLASKVSSQGDSSDSDNVSDIEIASKDSEIEVASKDSEIEIASKDSEIEIASKDSEIKITSKGLEDCEISLSDSDSSFTIDVSSDSSTSS